MKIEVGYNGYVMLGYLILLFTVVPILELALLIRVGQFLGVGNAIGIVIITGLFGAILTKSQGLLTVEKIQKDLNEGIMPTERLLDGLLILCGGILLITPGLITDTLGLTALIPLSRGLIKGWIKRKIRQAFEEGKVITLTRFSIK